MQKYGDFNPVCALKIAQDVRSKLIKVHFAYLLSEFGLSFLNKYLEKPLARLTQILYDVVYAPKT